ncbi:zinc finger protein with KRAB and SCAN domains 1-like [Gracilinanus agilis]|uniref:zinc finger protein with KRAB and SCAN domains 1-like n=1 Tax=Gracilinanus agilis TaxID=191870 RepID=UPI001CFE8153|nr:zinc finger protein with KRAB and SCAN domains 1-like [Gracilinanus agilis]
MPVWRRLLVSLREPQRAEFREAAGTTGCPGSLGGRPSRPASVLPPGHGKAQLLATQWELLLVRQPFPRFWLWDAWSGPSGGLRGEVEGPEGRAARPLLVASRGSPGSPEGKPSRDRPPQRTRSQTPAAAAPRPPGPHRPPGPSSLGCLGSDWAADSLSPSAGFRSYPALSGRTWFLLYACDQSGKAFRRGSSLISHFMSHSREKPYEVQDCRKAFPERQKLTQHQRMHTREKPYKHKECGKGFDCTPPPPPRHHIIHTGEKPCEYGDCGKAFNRSATLTGHQVIHAGEKPSGGNEGGKAFRQKRTYSTPESSRQRKPSKCHQCGKVFCLNNQLTQPQMIHMEEKGRGKAHPCSVSSQLSSPRSSPL